MPNKTLSMVVAPRAVYEGGVRRRIYDGKASAFGEVFEVSATSRKFVVERLEQTIAFIKNEFALYTGKTGFAMWPCAYQTWSLQLSSGVVYVLCAENFDEARDKFFAYWPQESHALFHTDKIPAPEFFERERSRVKIFHESKREEATWKS